MGSQSTNRLINRLRWVWGWVWGVVWGEFIPSMLPTQGIVESRVRRRHDSDWGGGTNRVIGQLVGGIPMPMNLRVRPSDFKVDQSRMKMLSACPKWPGNGRDEWVAMKPENENYNTRKWKWRVRLGLGVVWWDPDRHDTPDVHKNPFQMSCFFLHYGWR